MIDFLFHKNPVSKIERWKGRCMWWWDTTMTTKLTPGTGYNIPDALNVCQQNKKMHLCRVISPWAHTPPACRSHFWCPASGPCRLWTAEWRERGKQRAKTKPSNNETHRRKEGGCRKKRRRKKGREEENTVSGFSSQETEDEVGCRKNRSGWALKPFQRRGVG